MKKTSKLLILALAAFSLTASAQEKTPAFTTLKSAIVPVKPAGPKRMLFVAGMLILASVVTSGLILLREEPTHAVPT